MDIKTPGSSSSGTGVEINPLDYELPPSTGSELGSVEPHVFTNPRRAAHWLQVYEKATYEGRHRFDASWTWTPEEEKRLRRKVYNVPALSLPSMRIAGAGQ